MSKDSFDEMIEETTRQAREFIKEQPELRDIVTAGKEKGLTIKQLANILQNAAIAYAQAHNGNFGELFETELEAVDWMSLLGEL
jgi:hypothetical protein